MKKCPAKPKMSKANTSGSAKGQVHEAAAQGVVKTIPGGFIA